MLLTETILIKLLKDGNQDVYRSIYEKYFGSLFIFAKEYVQEDEVAKEMVQDTFLKLWEKRTSLDNDTNIQSFLYRITRNNCLNYIKHLKVQQKYHNFSKSKQIETELNFTALNHESLEKLISAELEEKINKAVLSLPPRCKQIFEFSRNDEKKYREIADELNISIKTVENQIQKALNKLRQHLSEFMTLLLIILTTFFN